MSAERSKAVVEFASVLAVSAAASLLAPDARVRFMWACVIAWSLLVAFFDDNLVHGFLSGVFGGWIGITVTVALNYWRGQKEKKL